MESNFSLWLPSLRLSSCPLFLRLSLSLCFPASLWHSCFLSAFSLSGIWVMAQAPRGFLWQMSSSMPWSLPPVSQCAPPRWKTSTHQHLPVAQQGNSCPSQGKFHNRWPAVLRHCFSSFPSFALLVSGEWIRWGWEAWVKRGHKQRNNENIDWWMLFVHE